MDFDHSELPSVPLLFFPEVPTRSQSPFHSEDDVGNDHLPPRPSSVCEECWRGLFAMHFGLPLVLPQSGKWYRRWPEEISYSTSLAKLDLRADEGCVWCQYLLSMVVRLGCRYDPEPNESLTITVRGTTDTWNEDTGYTQRPYQRIYVEVKGYTEFEALVHADPGMSDYLQALWCWF